MNQAASRPLRTATLAAAPAMGTPAGSRRGIALVTVLMVMVAVMVLGAGSLMMTNSNLMVSENLLSSAVARSQAEAGVDAIVTVLFDQYRVDGRLPATLAYAPSVTLPGGQVNYALANAGYERHDDHRVTVRAVGYGPRGAEYVAEALLVFAAGEARAGASPFTGAIVACEAIDVSGSGRIDSFDSRTALYQSSGARANAHVQTLNPGGTVTISGASPILGDVYSTGGVTASGSARVEGNVHASGNVTIQAAATYYGDVRTTGAVALNNSATVRGSVVANGNVDFNNAAKVQGDAISSAGRVHFANTSAYVTGDARAATTVTTVWHTGIPKGQNVGGSVVIAPSTAVQPVASEPCDPLGIRDVMQPFKDLPDTGALQVGGYPTNRWEIRPTGVRVFDETWNVDDWVNQPSRVMQPTSVFGQEIPMLRVSSLNLTSVGSLRITGGDVAIFVDGDLTLGSGASSLRIDEGSSLTIFVSGKTTMGNAGNMSNVPPINYSASGLPTLSVFSSYDSGNNTGVTVSGASVMTATVYAPFSRVVVGGSGALHGAVRGKQVRVEGAGGIHYDEALATVPVGETGSSGGGGEPRLVAISRR